MGVEGPRSEFKEEEKVVKDENVEDNEFEASSVSTVRSGDQKKDLKELITRTVERQVEKALKKIMDERSVGNSRLEESYHTSRAQQDDRS